MADSGALMTTDRVTVTWDGSPSATAAKMPTRTTRPRTKRVIGRITSPPYSSQHDGRSPEIGLSRRQCKPLAFLEKTIKVRASTSGRGPEMNLSPPSTMVFIVSVILWRFGRDWQIRANSVHHRARFLGRHRRLCGAGGRQSVQRRLAFAASGRSERHPEACRALHPQFPLALNQLVRAPAGLRLAAEHQ